jgi:RimJ/RimL family protein N-acetyltransferase
MSDPVTAGEVWSVAEAQDDARAVLHFLRHGLATRDIDPARPVWIVDLAPGNGERAWLVLRYLAERAPRAPMLRYLACCASGVQREMLSTIEVLCTEVRSGRLVIADEKEGFCRHDMRNPAMVLAHGACAAREQALFACHYGKLLAGARQSDGQIGWAPLQARDDLSSLLSAYCRAINSAPLNLPVGFIRCVQTLLAATGGRMLLRASDPGVMNLVQIRGGMLAAEAVTAQVNFEVLARWHRALGATVHQAQYDDGGRVLHVAVHDRTGGRLRACLADVLELAHPDVRAAAVSAMQGMAPNPMTYAAWIEQVQADPRIVPLCADALLALTGKVQGTALRHWRELLVRLCGNYYPGWHDAPLIRFLASLAMRLEDWGLACKLLRQALRDCDDDDDRMLCWQMLAECQERTGALVAAQASLMQAKQVLEEGTPAHDELRCVIERIAHRIAHQQERPAYVPSHAYDGLLCLEPLDDTHAADFFYQYRDPQIALMTRLPELADAEAVRCWIADRARQPDRLDCAVMHAELGFVGVVSAHRSRGDAFVHFWIGVDYQGSGHAAPAVRLLIRMLAVHGALRIFTAVYPDNYRSRRTLLSVGFVKLPISAAAPENETLFFGCACRTGYSIQTLSKRLRAFVLRTDSIFSFADVAPVPVRLSELS